MVHSLEEDTNTDQKRRGYEQHQTKMIRDIFWIFSVINKDRSKSDKIKLQL